MKPLANVFLTDLAAYTTGDLIGEWISLPMDESVLSEKIRKICGDHEFFITDYETKIAMEIGEYTNIFQLNRTLQTVEALHQYDTVAAYLEANGGTLEDALEDIKNCEVILYKTCKTLKELAYALVENGYLGEVRGEIKKYIDYDAIARTLDCQGYTETTYGVLYV